MFLILLSVPLLVGTFIIALAYHVRRKFGYNKWLLLCSQLLFLTPWFTHYLMFLQMAGVDRVPFQALIVPPLILILTAVLTLVNVSAIRAANIMIPGIAFSATYSYVMPLVYSAVQDYKFDNIPTIWLFVWITVATLSLIAYLLPNVNHSAVKIHGNL